MAKYATANGKKYELTQGSCSCCGTSPGKNFSVVRAGLVDSDGVYYALLCAEVDEGQAWGGCLEDVLREQARKGKNPRQEKANILRSLLGENELADGIASEMAE